MDNDHQQQQQQHTTIVQMHRADDTTPPPQRFFVSATRASAASAAAPPLKKKKFSHEDDDVSPVNDKNDDVNDDNDDETDGKGQEVLQRLLSPQGTLATELVKEIVQHLASAERTADLATMSRRRYAMTQCVTVLIALLAVATVILVTFCNNDILNELILQALNTTSKAFITTTTTTTTTEASAAASAPSSNAEYPDYSLLPPTTPPLTDNEF